MSPSPRNKPVKEGRRARKKLPGGDIHAPQSAGINGRAVVITRGLLRRWPLPQPSAEGDKEDRGCVLVVGGAPEMPGAVILAATAALRAGAGKLQIATCRSIAQLVAAAVPEARVFALPETKTGAVAASAAAEIARRAAEAQAMLIGPGMVDKAAVMRLMTSLLPRLRHTAVVIDAAALAVLARDHKLLHGLKSTAIITPHAGEMAGLSGISKAAVTREPLVTARRAAADFRAVVALKGAETFIAVATGDAYCNRTGNVGLATSGSGDTLSGIITGLLARGAEPLQATAWGVYLHASAGDRLARRMGRLGFLARELLAEIPVIMSNLDRGKKR